MVDAYGSGQLLGAALRARGVAGVHVANRLCDWPQLTATLHRPDFTSCLDYQGDLLATVGRLRDLGVRHVVAGAESGAVVANELAWMLGTATANPPGAGAARRDKRLMHWILADAGVPVPWQQHFDAGGLTWSSDGAPAGPFVVKPPASAGTHSVTVVPDLRGAHAAVKQLRSAQNLYGERNDGAVVQEYLHGLELMVNTVSADGVHCFVDLWTSEKRTARSRVIYDRQRLIDPESAIGWQARDYVRRVLDALGVRWGPAHTELVITERGPLLLETATRLPGGADPALTLRAFGTSQASEVIDSLLAPEVVVSRGEVRPLRCAAMGVSLISPASGRLGWDVDTRPLTGLASFHGMRAHLSAGDRVLRTVDLVTKPGGLYLCHPDPEQVEADYQQVREWEATDLAAAIVEEPAGV